MFYIYRVHISFPVTASRLDCNVHETVRVQLTKLFIKHIALLLKGYYVYLANFVRHQQNVTSCLNTTRRLLQSIRRCCTEDANLRPTNTRSLEHIIVSM